MITISQVSTSDSVTHVLDEGPHSRLTTINREQFHQLKKWNEKFQIVIVEM